MLGRRTFSRAERNDVTATMTSAREIRLASRPGGWPTPGNFELVEVAVPELGEGQVLVRNQFLSVDPYHRGRMNAGESYIEPFEVAEAMEGAAIGVVVESRSASFEPGDVVAHQHGWREVALGDADAFYKMDASAVAASAYLGVLGMPGLIAYVGVTDIAQVGTGDTVFVSGAAGAVGSLAGQVAKLRGSERVIGSAGSAEKVAYLLELGYDAAFNYKDGSVAEQLAIAAPDGIDVFFDNVGGEHLEAAIGAMNTHGRMALCGMIATANDASPTPGPTNLFELLARRITVRGMLVTDHLDRLPAFYEEVGGWLRDGQVSYRETIVDGIENMPDAFLGLFRGNNVGKMIVRLEGPGA
jgi:NADPH-dependent curcumin reductase CurA